MDLDNVVCSGVARNFQRGGGGKARKGGRVGGFFCIKMTFFAH